MEFKEFPKIARLSREIIVTEKIDEVLHRIGHSMTFDEAKAALKEIVMGCVPEVKRQEAGINAGHNDCRTQTIQNIERAFQ